MSTIPTTVPSQPPLAKGDNPINLLRGWPSPSLLPPSLLLNAAQQALSDPSISTPGLSYGPDEGYPPLREALATYLSTFYNRPTESLVTADRITITGGASQNLASLLSAFTDPSYTRKVFVSEPAYFLAFPIFEDAGFGARDGRMVGVREDDEGVELVALERELEESEKEKNGTNRSHNDNGRTEKGDYDHDGVDWQSPLYKPDFAKIYKYIIYCVPSFSNPSGRTMSLPRREGLVRLARKYDALVVCDDVYDFLQWSVDGRGQEPDRGAQESTAHDDSIDENDHLQRALLPRVVDIDRDLEGGAERAGADGYGNVASNGSFSKILGPGLRVGWCEGAPKLAYGVSQTGATRSGGAPSQLTSTYIVPLLRTGKLQHHISRTLRPAYARRYARLRAAIATFLEPRGFRVLSPTTSFLPNSFYRASLSLDNGHCSGAESGTSRDGNGDRTGDGIAGGFFIWLSIPPKLQQSSEGRKAEGGAKVYAARCLKEGQVVISPGVNFEVPSTTPDGIRRISRSRFDAEFRLCFAYVDEDELEEGVRRMGVVAAKMLDEANEDENARDSLDDTIGVSEDDDREDEGYVIIDHHEAQTEPERERHH